VQVQTLNPGKGFLYFVAPMHYTIYDMSIYMCLNLLYIYYYN